MSFIRPEASEQLRRARPFILSGLVAVAGFYVMFHSRGTAWVAGLVFLGIAGLIAHDGWKRMRFPSGSGGPGVVEVDERRVTYMSGTGGQSISMDTLDRVEVHRNRRGRITWVFYDVDGMMSVPGDAHGTDKLFDALVSLPGVNYAQAEAASQGQGPDMFLIWARDRRKLH